MNSMVHKIGDSLKWAITVKNDNGTNVNLT